MALAFTSSTSECVHIQIFCMRLAVKNSNGIIIGVFPYAQLANGVCGLCLFFRAVVEFYFIRNSPKARYGIYIFLDILGLLVSKYQSHSNKQC